MSWWGDWGSSLAGSLGSAYFANEQAKEAMSPEDFRANFRYQNPDVSNPFTTTQTDWENGRQTTGFSPAIQPLFEQLLSQIAAGPSYYESDPYRQGLQARMLGYQGSRYGMDPTMAGVGSGYGGQRGAPMGQIQTGQPSFFGGSGGPMAPQGPQSAASGSLGSLSSGGAPVGGGIYGTGRGGGQPGSAYSQGMPGSSIFDDRAPAGGGMENVFDRPPRGWDGFDPSSVGALERGNMGQLDRSDFFNDWAGNIGSVVGAVTGIPGLRQLGNWGADKYAGHLADNYIFQNDAPPYQSPVMDEIMGNLDPNGSFMDQAAQNSSPLLPQPAYRPLQRNQSGSIAGWNNPNLSMISDNRAAGNRVAQQAQQWHDDMRAKSMGFMR